LDADIFEEEKRLASGLTPSSTNKPHAESPSSISDKDDKDIEMLQSMVTSLVEETRKFSSSSRREAGENANI